MNKRLPIITLQWLLVLGILAIVGYRLTRPEVQPERQPESWAQWDHFIAISYPGITVSEDPRYTSPERLKEHLKALRAAGYRSIATSDLPRFLSGQKPLPEKALLILFESGRRDSMIRATPILAENHFQAVMAMPTGRATALSRLYLQPADIQKVSALAYWEFASSGHHADEMITIDSDGNKGHYLSRFLMDKGRQEPAVDYRTRVESDYAKAAKRLTQLTGVAPHAYCYPYSDAGQGRRAVSVAESVNRLAVQQHHGVAFVDYDDAVNGSHRDRYRLSCLRVQGDWSATDLVERLAADTLRTRGFKEGLEPSGWLAGPQVRFEPGAIVLNEDSRCLALGSDAWRNVELEASYTRDPGARFVVYLRFNGRNAFIRVVIEDEQLVVQERLGDRMQNIVTRKIEQKDTENRLVLRIREQRLRMELNGNAVGGGVALAPYNVRGRIGFGSEGGSTTLSACRAQPVTGRIVETSHPEAVPSALRAEAGQFLLPWLNASAAPSLTPTRRSEAIRLAAEGIDVVPLIANIPEDVEISLWVGALKASLHESALGSIVRRLAVDGINTQWGTAIRSIGYGITYRLTEAPTEYELDQIGLHEAEIVLPACSQEDYDRILRWIPPHRVTVLDVDPDEVPVGMRQGIRFTKESGGDS